LEVLSFQLKYLHVFQTNLQEQQKEQKEKLEGYIKENETLIENINKKKYK